MWWQILSAVSSALALIISSTMFIAIKFNDVKHIQIAVEKIEKAVEEMKKVNNNLNVTVAEIITRCEERQQKYCKQ